MSDMGTFDEMGSCGMGSCGDGSCSSDCSSCGCDCQSAGGGLPNTITLTMDDDTEVVCAILTVYSVEANEYIAVLPLDENGEPQGGEVYLYKFTRTPAGDPMLDNIEDDEEYEAAAERFNQVMEQAREDEANNVPLE
ncbi:MAG: DUF1292 domain-containing protein [Eubacteriales bacterium]|nr:DUF1292 domain-containing protein [Eubacteriales bacterium]